MAELFRQAQDIGAAMGVALDEGSTGGGSDGNFTAAIGVPTLDGLGAEGEGAHAAHEHVLVDSLPRRAALLAGSADRRLTNIRPLWSSPRECWARRLTRRGSPLGHPRWHVTSRTSSCQAWRTWCSRAVRMPTLA